MADPRLMIPGPVEADDDVLAAIGAQTLPHYGPTWMRLFDETTDLLKRLFETEQSVLMIPGPGTAALEASITSLVPRGESVATLSNGFFGERMLEIVEHSGLHARPVRAELGEPVDPGALRASLAEMIPQAERAGEPVRALAVVHHETSTGVLNPLQEIAAVAHEFDLAVIVDAVASFGGVRIAFDEWGIDACTSVPNKCLGAPPGVGLLALSDRAWDMAAANTTPHGWYLDLRTWAWYIENWGDWHPYPTTMPTNNIAALHAALQKIFAVGPERHYSSIAWAADCTRSGLLELGFTLFPNPAFAAPVISAFNVRPDIDAAALQHYLLEQGLMVSGGLGELQGQIFRVGHMGRAKEPAVVEALLAATRDFLHEEGLPL